MACSLPELLRLTAHLHPRLVVPLPESPRPQWLATQTIFDTDSDLWLGLALSESQMRLRPRKLLCSAQFRWEDLASQIARLVGMRFETLA